MPEDLPDNMPDRMPEDMSDRMPEDLPVTKCINVMVGITRSKVIIIFLFVYISIYYDLMYVIYLCIYHHLSTCICNISMYNVHIYACDFRRGVPGGSSVIDLPAKPQ